MKCLHSSLAVEVCAVCLDDMRLALAEAQSRLDLATGDADHLRGRLTETLSRLDVVSKEVEGMEALLEKEHNDLLAWKHRATSAEDRLDAARKYLKEVLGRTPYSTDKQLVAANALNELNGAVRHPVVETSLPIEKCNHEWVRAGWTGQPATPFVGGDWIEGRHCTKCGIDKPIPFTHEELLSE